METASDEITAGVVQGRPSEDAKRNSVDLGWTWLVFYNRRLENCSDL